MMKPEEMEDRINELTARVELLESGRRKIFERPQPIGDKNWPAWFYPPEVDGEGRIFTSQDQVPEGWQPTPHTEPEKVRQKPGPKPKVHDGQSAAP